MEIEKINNRVAYIVRLKLTMHPQLPPPQIEFITPSPSPLSRPSLDGVHILKQELEAVAQGAHVRVHGLLQLKGVGDDLDGPALELGVLPSLEAEVEVSRIFGADAEGVHASFRVGFRIGCQPAIWKKC